MSVLRPTTQRKLPDAIEGSKTLGVQGSGREISALAAWADPRSVRLSSPRIREIVSSTSTQVEVHTAEGVGPLLSREPPFREVADSIRDCCRCKVYDECDTLFRLSNSFDMMDSQFGRQNIPAVLQVGSPESET